MSNVASSRRCPLADFEEARTVRRCRSVGGPPSRRSSPTIAREGCEDHFLLLLSISLVILFSNTISDVDSCQHPRSHLTSSEHKGDCVSRIQHRSGKPDPVKIQPFHPCESERLNVMMNIECESSVCHVLSDS